MGQGDAPERKRRALATAFDPVFYRTVYDDIARVGADPFLHYVETGWQEGRDPAPWFSVSGYLERHPEAGGGDPFLHYLLRGWREGCEPSPSRHRERFLERVGASRKPITGAPVSTPSEASVPEPVASVQVGPDIHVDPDVVVDPDSHRESDPDLPPGLTRESARGLVTAAFDHAYYLSAYPDIAAAGVDPLDHYLTAGRREGRDPRPDFNPADYLEVNPDVGASGVDPFLHWLVAGKAEGRPLRFELGFRGRIIPMVRRLEDRIAASLAANSQKSPWHPNVLKVIRNATNYRKLHISISHDDFTAHVGGVQLCLQVESREFGSKEIDHLHLFPAVPWPTVRPSEVSAHIGVVWNGRTLGLFEPRDIQAVLRKKAASSSMPATFAIHSLLGHEIDETLDILAAAGARRGLFWMHDFAGLCAGYHLMRDEVQDCGAPPAGSAACRICVFGPGRDLHLSAHRRLFETLDLTLVAPSQAALDTWNAAPDAPQARRQVVHPHARLAPTGRRAGGDPDAPLTVAFLGMPSAYKGWPVFTDLAHRFGEDPRYRFVRLGSAAAPGPADHIEVSVTANNPHAMHLALETAGVDVAVLWSLCRETFSFAAYEAAAAGAAILTGPDSGNIAAFTRTGGHGLVLPDEATLFAQFESGAVRHLSRASRNPEICDIAYSGMSVDLLEALS